MYGGFYVINVRTVHVCFDSDRDENISENIIHYHTIYLPYIYMYDIMLDNYMMGLYTASIYFLVHR